MSDMIGNQVFQVEGSALLSLNGWALKVYILLRNSESALTCNELAKMLNVHRDCVWLPLQRLVERCFIRRVDNRKYALSVFPNTPLKEMLTETNNTLCQTNNLLTETNNCGIFGKEQERSKEKENIPLPPGNAPARPREDFDFYFSQITDDESLRPYAEEFLRGLRRQGVDLTQKTDLQDHFHRWLPKYQAKMEIESRKTAALKVERGKPDYQIEEQMRAKRRREEKAEELQRQLDAQQAEAEVAGDAREAFFARYGKPKGSVKNFFTHKGYDRCVW